MRPILLLLAVQVSCISSQLDSEDPYPADQIPAGGTASGGTTDTASEMPEPRITESTRESDTGIIPTEQCPPEIDEALVLSMVDGSTVNIDHIGADMPLCPWTPEYTIDAAGQEVWIDYQTADPEACGDDCDYSYRFTASDLSSGVWTINAGSSVETIELP